MMEALKDNRTQVPQSSTNKYIYFGILLSFLIILALYINNFSRAVQGASLPKGTVVISQGTLAEKYGLRINLVAVTAAGGMVDVRLKIVDGEKFKALLADNENFPALLTERGVVLNAPEETKSQEIQFITGGNLFIIYPNSGNAIKADSPVTILFGNIAVEPVNAR